MQIYNRKLLAMNKNTGLIAEFYLLCSFAFTALVSVMHDQLVILTQQY